jgi:antitoxin YefM
MYIITVHINKGGYMPLSTTYTDARANLKELCDQVTSTRSPVIIHRRNAEDVALISADELGSLIETVHLLRSPANAKRLLTALIRAQSKNEKSASVSQLKKDLGIK